MAFLIALSGCGNEPRWPDGKLAFNYGRFGTLTEDSTVLTCALPENKKLLFLVWSDAPKESGGAKIKKGVSSSYGRFTFSDGNEVNWNWEHPKSGEWALGGLQIGDTQYPLSDGPLFLLRLKNGKPVVKQIEFDLSSLVDDRETIEELLKDPDLSEFFTEDRRLSHETGE